MIPSIEVADLWKRFRLYHENYGTLKSALLQLWRNRSEDLWVLQGISFQVFPGETVAVIGPNGTGKSTLLGLLGRVLRPTRGTAVARGRVSTLLDLGAGFHPDLTGTENLYLNGCILGMSRREVDRKRESIIAFAELEKFIDVPLRNYSSGMAMRLGFGIAIHYEPQVMLVDEVLTVGDDHFQAKCYRQIEALQRGGCAILFVSHDMAVVRRVATRVIWLRDGRIAGDGHPDQVVDAYLGAVAAVGGGG
ncbi:MAG: ABC transporter ATP-binding protein [Armatimonadetes bacterium]|nr:ABC transporter ATP-binding protein [Armatimonadota bacterium]